jgi:hypothetical protein
MAARFSKIYPLEELSDFPIDQLTGRPGVYRIRGFSDGKPLQFSRLNGKDPDGILHIGMSQDLFKRLRSFRKGAILEKFPAHFASSEYIKWGFKTLVAPKNLCFDFVVTQDAATAKSQESKRSVVEGPV